jgi:tight adherence protein C
MNQHLILLLGSVTVLLLMLSTAINMLWSTLRLRRIAGRMDQALAVGTSQESSPLGGIIGQLQALGIWLRRFYAPANIEHMRSLIQVAGFNPHRMLPVMLGCKFVLMVVFPVLAVIVAYSLNDFRWRIAVVGVGIILGIMGPEWILGVFRRRFVAAIERGTPDTIDLLVVCSEAGMGLESALERVATEMQNANRPIAVMLAALSDDLRVLPNRQDAFVNLGTRSGVVGLRRLGAMLSQSIQYGTPLGHALRAVAVELRNDRMNKLEERAVKLSPKLMFPLIFCIMPSLYIELLGPTFMRLYDSLKSFGSAMPHQ